MRRITAVTAQAAEQALAAGAALQARADALEGSLEADANALKAEVDAADISYVHKLALRTQLEGVLRRALEGKKAAAAALQADAAAAAVREAAVAVAAGEAFLVRALDVPAASKALDAAYKAVEKSFPELPCLFLSPDAGAGKCGVLAAVPKALSKRLNAGDWCKAALEVLGGKGGGKAGSAQGSGPDVAKADDAAAAAADFAKLKL